MSSLPVKSILSIPISKEPCKKSRIRTSKELLEGLKKLYKYIEIMEDETPNDEYRRLVEQLVDKCYSTFLGEGVDLHVTRSKETIGDIAATLTQLHRELNIQHSKGLSFEDLKRINEIAKEPSSVLIDENLLKAFNQLQQDEIPVTVQSLMDKTGYSNHRCYQWLKQYKESHEVVKPDLQRKAFERALDELQEFNDNQPENALRKKITLASLTKEAKIAKSKASELYREQLYKNIINAHHGKYW